MQEELDELNRLFTSKNVDDVIKFYDHFDTAEQLIQWMKNRPSAPMKIYEVGGYKDIVVVIPTANHDGEYAKNCADNIFKGQQIVFVESNGPFFNYARSCNFGLKYALKYKPRWVVLSNDDIIKLDEMTKFKNKLAFIKADLVFPSCTNSGHFFASYLVKPRFTLSLLYKLKGGIYKLLNKLYQKYQVKYFGLAYYRKFINKFLYKKISKLPGNSAFIIFSNGFLNSTDAALDETCINSSEDLLLSIKHKDSKLEQVNFNISDAVGGSLGSSPARIIKDLNGIIYFNHSLSKLK